MPVVLLHPVGLDARSFQLLDPDLLDQCIAYDLLWHGGRPQPAEPMTLEALADDVVEHTTGSLDVVGVSLGGAVAQYIALRHPERVRSLLLASSTAGDGSPERLREQEERAAMTLAGGMAGLVDWAVQRWFTAAARESSESSGMSPAIAYVRDRLLRDDPHAVAAGWLAMGHSDSLLRLHQVSAPTTILHPDQDVAPLAKKEQMARVMPHARVSIIEGPHMVHLEQPDAFSAALSDHLTWSRGPA